MLVDSALASRSLGETRRLFKLANQMIIDDAAAVWLYEPRSVLAIHSRIKPAAMRPNAWWLGLAGWTAD